MEVPQIHCSQHLTTLSVLNTPVFSRYPHYYLLSLICAHHYRTVIITKAFILSPFLNLPCALCNLVHYLENGVHTKLISKISSALDKEPLSSLIPLKTSQMNIAVPQ